MKTCIKSLLLRYALTACFGLMLGNRVTAQTFSNLYSFTGGGDGGNPEAGLILSGNTLYGTTAYDGSEGYGVIFALNTNGTDVTTLYSFTRGSNGIIPRAGLMLLANTLYGTTSAGGNAGKGTVFAVNTDGTSFATLYSFTGVSDGANPNAGLLSSGNVLYGTASGGGGWGKGTVFAVNTDGTGFTNLHSFTALNNGTNSDGANPNAGLILSSNVLYGTASGGGSSGQGTVFAVNTDGTGFTNLHSFTGSDGSIPWAVILSGNTLYGTTYGGGSGGSGTVFAVNIDGTGFATIYSFPPLPGLFPPHTFTNMDGANPEAGLILSGNTLYGTTAHGGTSSLSQPSGDGTLFAVNTDGTGFTNLYSFTAGAYNSLGFYINSDGASPWAGLVLSGNTLYGTAETGGSSGNGTVFSLSLPVTAPQLTIVPSGANVVLTWAANATGFTLQCATNLVPANWIAVSPGPVVVNGQNTVTNPISGTQQFYRLSQ